MRAAVRGSVVAEALEYRRILRDGRLTPREMEALQARKLRDVIRHACENVPYYRDLFRSAGITPSDVRTAADLEHVPVTTKNALRDAGVARTTAAGIDLAACAALRTNGTTGEPFTVYVPRDEARTRRLVELRGLRSIGFGPRDRLSILGPDRPFRARLRHRLGLYRTETISASLTVEEHIRRLRAFQPTILWTYPTLLRAILLRRDYRLSDLVRPRVLIVSAEMFSPVLRQRIEAELPGIRIFNSYGAMEFGRIALECPAHEGLHMNVDQVILEAQEEDGPAAVGEPGVAVLTHLYARAMPLIRYRLGDIVSRIGEPCSCGSSLPLIHAPQGRNNDMIRLPSGRVMSPIPLQYVLRGLGGVDQFRFIQDATDHIVLQLVAAAEPSADALEDLRSRLQACCGEPVRWEIQILDRLSDDRPKFKSFLSKLDGADLVRAR